MGLYEEDVHYDLTYNLALEAGFPPDVAAMIARGDQGTDVGNFEGFTFGGYNGDLGLYIGGLDAAVTSPRIVQVGVGGDGLISSRLGLVSIPVITFDVMFGHGGVGLLYYPTTDSKSLLFFFRTPASFGEGDGGIGIDF